MKAELDADPARLLADMAGAFGSRDDLMKAMRDLKWLHSELDRVDDSGKLFEEVTGSQNAIQTMLMGALWMSGLIKIEVVAP